MRINFSALWNAHPEVSGEENPCRLKDGRKAFDDQCAIRIGVALTRCGYDMTKLPGRFFWSSFANAREIWFWSVI